MDASTTIDVPRDWSERELPRSASVFFTHNGLSAVMLLEDAGRTTRLASLEAQYYRAVINEEWEPTICGKEIRCELVAGVAITAFDYPSI